MTGSSQTSHISKYFMTSHKNNMDYEHFVKDISKIMTGCTNCYNNLKESHSVSLNTHIENSIQPTYIPQRGDDKSSNCKRKKNFFGGKQCVNGHYNADDIQLAMAISKSEEYTKEHSNRPYKVQKEVTESLNTKATQLHKWVQKKSRLTIREITLQNIKLWNRCEIVLNQQITSECPDNICDYQFSPCSDLIKEHVVLDKEGILLKEYVNKLHYSLPILFAQIGTQHLLKNWKNIKGRSPSPEKKIPSMNKIGDVDVNEAGVLRNHVDETKQGMCLKSESSNENDMILNEHRDICSIHTCSLNKQNDQKSPDIFANSFGEYNDSIHCSNISNDLTVNQNDSVMKSLPQNDKRVSVNEETDADIEKTRSCNGKSQYDNNAQDSKDHILKINNRIYEINLSTSPKPKYMLCTRTEIIEKLASYGIKPLKDNLAYKMLKYIYNQTHPLLMQSTEKNSQSNEHIDKECITNVHDFNVNYLNFKCSIPSMIQSHVPKLDTIEEYILPKNRKKSVSNVPLPLHIAWYNLICSNNDLHESILKFAVINLIDIYKFFKKIGFHYSITDIRRFLDHLSILFYSQNQFNS